MTTIQITSRLELVIGNGGHARQLKAAIESELIAYFGLPPLQAAEVAERKMTPVAQLIARKEEECNNIGTVYALTLAGSAYDSVAGSCFAFPKDTPQVILLKTNRKEAESLLDAIRALTFNEFERFGAKVLQELGATKTHITSHGNDQGIDFYGELSLGSLSEAPVPFFRLAHDVRIAFAGQAKHYPRKALGPDILRELVGAISLARTKTYSKANLDLLEEIHVKPFSPLLALLFTTGDLSSGVIQLAAEAGLIARTGEQLAVFLADKGVGIVGKQGEEHFDGAAFSIWLNS